MNYKKLLSKVIKEKKINNLLLEAESAEKQKESLELTQTKIEQESKDQIKSKSFNISGMSLVDLLSLKKIKKKLEYFLNKRKIISTMNLYDMNEDKFPTIDQIETAVSDIVQSDSLEKKELASLVDLILTNIVNKIDILFKYNDAEKSVQLNNVLNLVDIESIFNNYILKNELEKYFGSNGILNDEVSDDWSITTESAAKEMINYYAKLQKKDLDLSNESAIIEAFKNTKIFDNIRISTVGDNKIKGIAYRITPAQKLFNLFGNSRIVDYENKLLAAAGIVKRKEVLQQKENNVVINPETTSSIEEKDIIGVKLEDFLKIYNAHHSSQENFNNSVGNTRLRSITKLTTGNKLSSNLLKTIFFICQRYNFDDFNITYSTKTLSDNSYVDSFIENKIFNHQLKNLDTNVETNYFCNWLRTGKRIHEINSKNILNLDDNKIDLKNLLDLDSPEKIRSYYDLVSNSRTSISSNLAKCLFYLVARIKNIDIGNKILNIASDTTKDLLDNNTTYKNIIQQYISNISINEINFNRLVLNHDEFSLQKTSISEVNDQEIIKYPVSDVRIKLNNKIFSLDDFLHLDHVLEINGKKIVFKKFNIDKNEKIFFEKVSHDFIKKIYNLSNEEETEFKNNDYLRDYLINYMHTSIFDYSGNIINAKAIIPLVLTKIFLQTNEFLIDLNRIYHSWDYERNLNAYLIQNFQLLSNKARQEFLTAKDTDKEEKFLQLKSELKFISNPIEISNIFTNKNQSYIINEQDMFNRLGLNNGNKIKSTNIFNSLTSKKDKTYIGKGEDLIILFLLGVDIKESLKLIQNVEDENDLDISDQAIGNLISKFKLYSGDASSDDITFKPKLPIGIPENTYSLINNKVFEVKELSALSSNLRSGSTGIAAASKSISDIYKILDIIKEFVNETKQKSESKSLFSLILNYFETTLPRKKYIDLSNKLKNFYIDFKDLIQEEEESAERIKDITENSLNIESGAYTKEKVISLIQLYKYIGNALKFIINSYQHGIPEELNIKNLKAINEKNKRNVNVTIIDTDNTKFDNVKIPFSITSIKNPTEQISNISTELLVKIEDILELANKNDNNDLIEHIFDTKNSNVVHKLISKLAVKFYSKFSSITNKDILNENLDNFLKPEDCFKNLDGLFLFFNSNAKKIIIYVPRENLNSQLVFTSTSQHRPNFTINKNEKIYKTLKNSIVENI